MFLARRRKSSGSSSLTVSMSAQDLNANAALLKDQDVPEREAKAE